MVDFPKVTRIYQNHHLDSTRWDEYTPRAGDIIVTTAYKSGTTWTQQILYELLYGRMDPKPERRDVTPWPDARFMPIPREALGPMIDRIPGRRFIKSHLPLDGLPYYEDVKYVIVGRDARDVFMSLFNHYQSYTDLAIKTMNTPDIVGDPLPRCPDDPLGTAPLDLRVNLARIDRATALARLAAGGIDGQPTPYSPAGVRLAGKPAINRSELFEHGLIEVQDEASQLIAYLVAPRRGEMVADFCAGAGGKTLALAAIMRSTGRLYAMDVSAKRLHALGRRAARAGVSNVHPLALAGEGDVRAKRLAGKIDRVLVDAPCSGFGTLRRNPDLKWRQGPESIEELAQKQHDILRAAARLVKPGGRLVYATCSILREENEAVVERFAAAHPEFVALSCDALLAAQRIPLEAGNALHLWPHRHGTDGFFAAAFSRGSSAHPGS